MSLTKRINRLAKNIVVIEDNGTGSGDAFSEFSGLKVAQLRTLAQQLGIRGYLKMKKAELVEALTLHQRGGTTEGAEAASTQESTKSRKILRHRMRLRLRSARVVARPLRQLLKKPLNLMRLPQQRNLPKKQHLARVPRPPSARNVPLAALEIHDLGKTVKLRTVTVPKRVRTRICLP